MNKISGLIMFLDDADATQKNIAIEELVIIGKPAVEPLIASIEDTDNFKRGAITVLGRIKDARAVESLIRVLEHKNDSYARSWAAKALGEIRDRKAVEPLIKALEDGD